MPTPHRQHRPALPSGRGFTLIELLVTISLLVLLLYMLATAFAAAQTAFTDTRRAVAAAQTARAVLDMLREELMGTELVDVYDPTAGATVRLLFQGLEGGTYSDSITFTTNAFQSARSLPGVTQVLNLPRVLQVHYAMQKKPDGADAAILLKKVDWDTDLLVENFDPAEGVGFNIKSLNFRYYDKAPAAGLPRWTAAGAWDKNWWRLPAAVEATILIEWLDSKSRKRTDTFSEIIYLPGSEVE